MQTTFWKKIEDYLDGKGCVRIDEQHQFGANAELIVDRSTGAPLADSRVVHFDPYTASYVIFSGERIRFNTMDGVTVFQESSPWDTQTRQDPPVNFHLLAEPLSRTTGNALRIPILYPLTESAARAQVRNWGVFTPAGIAWHAKEFRIRPKGPAALRIGMRFALDRDELLLSVGVKNISERPMDLTLVSFFMPLLTRGFAFNAESPWLHEGRVIPGKGYFLRSGEEGIACGIRYSVPATGGPAGTDHRDNTSSLKYYGGMNRDASFPAALEEGLDLDGDSQAGFVAPACANTFDRKILRPGQTMDLHFSVQAFHASGEALAYLDRKLTPAEVERKVRRAEIAARRLISLTHLEAPGRTFSLFFEWTKQQTSGCARIKSRFRLFWNYLLGIRDKAQAAAAATDFDPRIGRRMILELSGQQFEDGRFPRQYSFENAYDLRYFMDSGLWLAMMLVPHYLKCTGDFGVLQERVGYKILKDWNPEKKTGRVVDSPKRSTILDHLIEDVEHCIANRDPATGLVAIRDGDWNDAIGLIRNSLMALEQLYMSVGCLVELEKHLPGKIRRSAAGRRLSRHVPGYHRLMDKLHETFLKHGVQKSPDGRIRIIHGYTREGRTVGGFWDSDNVATEAELKKAAGKSNRSRWAESFRDAEGRTLYKLHRRWVDAACQKMKTLPQPVRDLFLVDRISSTPMSFALLSGILRHQSRLSSGTGITAEELEEAIAHDAAELDSRYGYRTFSRPFNRHSKVLQIGRIGNLDGAENASPYIHAGLFLCQGLYRIGRTAEANDFIDRTLPINRRVHARQNRGINYMPNSWGISGNNDGASMNDFHTNASGIFERIVVEEIVGLKVEYDGIEIQPVESLPALLMPVTADRKPLIYTTVLRGRRIKIFHRWSPACAARQIRLGHRDRKTSIYSPRRSASAFIRWSELRARSENVVTVIDPVFTPSCNRDKA